MLLPFEILFYLGVEEGVVAVVVLDDVAMFEQGDAGADVESVGEVVGGDDDGGVVLVAIGLEQVFHGELGGGVEEVEGFVEQEQLGIVEHGTDDAHFLLVAHRKVANEGFLTEHFAVHETIEKQQTVVQHGVGNVGYFCNKTEILFGGEIVDEEASIDKGTRVCLPTLAFRGVARDWFPIHKSVDGDTTSIGMQEVENDAEEGCLACTIIADKTDGFAAMNGIALDVEHFLLSE